VIGGREPRPEGALVYPGVHGATNWNSPSYSPDTKLLYVAVREEGTVFYRATAEYKAGNYFSAGGMRGIPGVEPAGSIQALDPLTGESAGNSRCTVRRGRECCRPRAGRCLAGRRRATCLCWTPRTENHFGHFRQALRFMPAR